MCRAQSSENGGFRREEMGCAEPRVRMVALGKRRREGMCRAQSKNGGFRREDVQSLGQK